MGGKALREIIVSNLVVLLESMPGLLGSGAAEAFMNEIVKVARRYNARWCVLTLVLGTLLLASREERLKMHV